MSFAELANENKKLKRDLARLQRDHEHVFNAWRRLALTMPGPSTPTTYEDYMVKYNSAQSTDVSVESDASEASSDASDVPNASK